MKLWEYEHPYYMAEGNYFASGVHNCCQNFESLDSFIEEWKDADIDLNRIHRWDFNCEDDQKLPTQVTFYYVIQRKANILSCTVKIDASKDEEKIRKFLRPHAILNQKLWEGV